MAEMGRGAALKRYGPQDNFMGRYVAAPPKILSVFPKGVSIASKATVPTINNLPIVLKISCKYTFL